ncbi:MAG: RteC domain-containing protein [Gelidibacter sp.]|nr:RteC domain-containing protein [Gelidibacter sp.]
MDWVIPQTIIEEEILQIEQSFISPIMVCHKIIGYCQTILETYRKHVSEKGFSDEATEIRFFKQDKQIPLSYIIQYSKQLAFELEFQNLVLGMDQDFIIKKIEAINTFFSMHQDFGVYMGLELENRDAFYFTRKHKESLHYMHFQEYRFDPEFNTSHDLLLATMTANRRFLGFLQGKQKVLNVNNQGTEVIRTPLQWTGSKASLVELGISLTHSGDINHGNAPKKEIILLLGDILGVDLRDHENTASRLKNRENPTRYLDYLKSCFERWIRRNDD